MARKDLTPIAIYEYLIANKCSMLEAALHFSTSTDTLRARIAALPADKKVELEALKASRRLRQTDYKKMVSVPEHRATIEQCYTTSTSHLKVMENTLRCKKAIKRAEDKIVPEDIYAYMLKTGCTAEECATYFNINVRTVNFFISKLQKNK